MLTFLWGAFAVVGIAFTAAVLFLWAWAWIVEQDATRNYEDDGPVITYCKRHG